MTSRKRKAEEEASTAAAEIAEGAVAVETGTDDNASMPTEPSTRKRGKSKATKCRKKRPRLEEEEEPNSEEQ